MKRCLVMLWMVLWALQPAAQQDKLTRGNLSPSVQQALRLMDDHDSVWVNAVLTGDTPKLHSAFRFLPAFPDAGIYAARISKKELSRLAGEKAVLFLNLRQEPHEELNTGAVDYTLNQLNRVHVLFPGVRGDSVFATIKERAFDTGDIDLKGRVFATGLQAAGQTSHASIMATIVAGAGNSSPFAAGAAPGAFVGSVDFANLFPAADSFYRNRKVSVENHSYGTIVENFYGAEALAHDVSAVGNPSLLHVFSAGNAGTATPTAGLYNGLASTANLTGNFKQAKNTLSVAALDSAGSPMAAASRGPAYDGRLKPELAAYGEDGSSGAAALVSGAALLVQDAFRKKTGQLPTSDMVKAVLINSAVDAGLPGIDYVTGYGSLNAARAVETPVQNRYFQGTVAPGGASSFSLAVPANLARLKITLAWTDAPAAVNAGKALVNDLDLQLRLGATSWLPWVLDPSPSLASLQAPAVRKIDTLNVVEQITIDNPAAGAYTIDVKGTRLASATQAFSIAYQFDTAGRFSWTFPNGNDALIAGRTHWLRWETTLAGALRLDYATSGANWRTIGFVNDASVGYFKWTVPDTVTTAVLRATSLSGNAFQSDTLVISPVVSVQTGFNCTDSFLLYWSRLPNAAFSVSELAGNYLQPFRQQADTALVLAKTQHPSSYYSVTPLVNGRPGMRSQTANYTASAVGCYIRSFFLQSQTGTQAFFTAEIGSLLNVQEVALERRTPTGFVTARSIVAPTSLVFSFSDSLLLQGENGYRFRVRLTSGLTVYSNIETVYHLPGSPVVLYPNPLAQNSVLTVLAGEAGRYTVQFFDVVGKLVKTRTLNSSRLQIDMRMLPKGIYFVRVVDARGRPFTQKLVVY